MRSTFYSTFTSTNTLPNTTDMREDLRARLFAFEQEYDSSDQEIRESGNMPSHYQEDVNLYLLDKAKKLINDIIVWDSINNYN